MGVDAYRTPDERFRELPGWPYEPRYVDQDGLRMHYVDEGEGAPIVLLHGEPTWGFLYRKMIPRLAEVGRVIVPDYFGFGRSDKPVEHAWYSYDRHVAAVGRLLCEQLDLRDATVVVQDWGGPIGLRLAVEQPERIERLVIMNTGIGARAPGEEWLRFQAFMERVGTDIVPGRLIRISCATELADEVVAGYDAPFPTPESKIGVVMFPRLVATGADHPSAPAMIAVREALRRWERPALVLFGDSDPIFTPHHAELMAELIPGAGPPQTVQGAAHFLQEDRGEEIAGRIASWLGTVGG
ncbi:putative hydrolase or acyltransferase (alpha/beta hydrolase superfamily) [Gaiella occulta]|uniref:Putative hydrolase or acyltransferase (Alpha/beta hydrolase superfamily) n=1 Tax=Gaiella occulta TaxID=1002870 RepID=A0A7M2Z0D2_9ACTN|nr:haloalkane dehalogenase [Gaiella occulta]RDI75233.1 putative hydrolase or acyltransferase (alpha/beta hydrolase superfamily) [Gaiella occulta]